MSRNQRFGLLLAAVAVVVVGIIVIGGGSDSKTTDKVANEPQTIVVKGGKADGDVKTITVNKGDKIDLTVQSDTADEIHIHGYDLMKDVEKGGSVHFAFPATIDGKFEIELEDAKEEIATLQVKP